MGSRSVAKDATGWGGRGNSARSMAHPSFNVQSPSSSQLAAAASMRRTVRPVSSRSRTKTSAMVPRTGSQVPEHQSRPEPSGVGGTAKARMASCPISPWVRANIGANLGTMNSWFNPWRTIKINVPSTIGRINERREIPAACSPTISRWRCIRTNVNPAAPTTAGDHSSAYSWNKRGSWKSITKPKA